MTREPSRPSAGLERLDSILGRVFSEVVRRAVGEERPSDQDSTPACEAEGALWPVTRLRCRGWVVWRLLGRRGCAHCGCWHATSRTRCSASWSSSFSKMPGFLTSVCEIANGPRPDPNPGSRHRTGVTRTI
jgi:hypothetical protein